MQIKHWLLARLLMVQSRYRILNKVAEIQKDIMPQLANTTCNSCNAQVVLLLTYKLL